ncbi:hypothetical protein NP233_g45 [Leucocoprinus birnbaumii]|uniref:Alkyl transferase n=1 Tax=Leucocoprinus birnbaumii TaxID=56174 RepID=A0AAD5Z0J1_9AGAR|nr:hypothetical protein NP233_g45 [Leucocoprinus birnbaumii]
MALLMALLPYLCGLYERLLVQAQFWLLSVLTSGPVPRHIAFIMDGNRRYARRCDMKVQKGHQAGASTLRRMVEVCIKINVYCISAYAFSLENFNRPSEEVDFLFGYLTKMLMDACEDGSFTRSDLFERYGVRLNVIGRVELFPETLQRVIRIAERNTRSNNRLMFNLYMPYTSQDEMTKAIQNCVQNASKMNDLNPDTYFVQEETDKHLMTSIHGSPPLDILVRTSGVKRLSDFMLWQV